MHYVIYPDTLFLENLICNLLFLAFLKQIFFHAATWKRICLSAFATAICNTLASILFFHYIWILQIGILLPAAVLMTCYCLKLKEPRRILYLSYQMILWLLALGGVLQAVEQWSELDVSRLLIWAVLFAVVFGIMEKVFRIYKRQNDCMREIVLYSGQKSWHIRGYADTGNQLYDPVGKKPVSILSLASWKLLPEEVLPQRYFLIPYRSMGNPDGILPGVQLDYMVICQGNESRVIEKPMIAITGQPFSGNFHYSILLHRDYC